MANTTYRYQLKNLLVQNKYRISSFRPYMHKFPQIVMQTVTIYVITK